MCPVCIATAVLIAGSAADNHSTPTQAGGKN